MNTKLAARLEATRQKVARAAIEAGRNSADVTLLAVSKTRTADQLRALFSQGQICFGENYLQEALTKQQQLADLAIEWHFIGPIQSNKTRAIASHFHWVHSVDRIKIARRLNEQRPEALAPLNICLQVNLDNEPSKSGLRLHELVEIVPLIHRLPRLQLRGLMAIPAPRQHFADQLASFNQLRHAASAFTGMDTLSMGMSADLEAAIQAGSTLVRVGTAIFGPR